MATSSGASAASVRSRLRKPSEIACGCGGALSGLRPKQRHLERGALRCRQARPMTPYPPRRRGQSARRTTVAPRRCSPAPRGRADAARLRRGCRPPTASSCQSRARPSAPANAPTRRRPGNPPSTPSSESRPTVRALASLSTVSPSLLATERSQLQTLAAAGSTRGYCTQAPPHEPAQASESPAGKRSRARRRRAPSPSSPLAGLRQLRVRLPVAGPVAFAKD